jgi:hypothetical protein
MRAMKSMFDLAHVALLIGCAALGFVAVDAQEPRPATPSSGSTQLSPSDKSELALVQQIYGLLGEEVWPGFAAAHIPILLYNDSYDFLLGTATAPDMWETVTGDDVNGQRYFRRKSVNPTGFAVKVGDQWVGSLACLEKARRDAPPQLLPLIREDQYAVGVLHEMFHAYQARASEKRFVRAQSVYRTEKSYPFQDKEFADAWNQEGAALATALDAKTAEATVASVQRFFSLRDARRRSATFTPAMLDFERELEWLEGLGKYAETRLYELAAKREELAAGNRFRPSPVYWSDGLRLRGQLGAQRGDLRFYLSGSAQARLLDHLAPDWKRRALDENAFLEDLLRKAAGASQPKTD